MKELPSNKEWIFWGRTDPLFGVASKSGREFDGPNPWTNDEFLEMGRKYFSEVWRQWEQYGTPGSKHCVEIGCGAGRITNQLVQVFDHVTALDVSPDQLAHASELLGEMRDRVTLTCVINPSIPLSDESCDAVFSCEVFQHFDTNNPLSEYMYEAFRVLCPGGTVCFQVPVHGITPATFLSSTIRWIILRSLRMLGRRRMMIYRRYRAMSVLKLLRVIGFRDLEVRMFHAEEQPGYHAYFYARKP